MNNPSKNLGLATLAQDKPDAESNKQRIVVNRKLHGFDNGIHLAPSSPQPSQDPSTTAPVIVEPSEEIIPENTLIQEPKIKIPANCFIRKGIAVVEVDPPKFYLTVQTGLGFQKKINLNDPQIDSSPVPENPSSEQQPPEDSESSISDTDSSSSVPESPPSPQDFVPSIILTVEPSGKIISEKTLIQESEKPSSPEIPGNFFFLDLKPVRDLKTAITALVDPAFNQEGTAMIEVDSSAFTLTVRTVADDSIVGHLRIDAPGFIKYDIEKPLLRKKINLNYISEHLHLVPDEDSVAICHLQDSDHLSFILPGGTPVPNFDVELHEIAPEFKGFPNLTYACNVAVSESELQNHLRHLKRSNTKMVSFGITYTGASLAVGPNRLDFTDKDARLSGMEPGQLHQVWFKWPYRKSLMKVSHLPPVFGLTTEPNSSIAWHFLRGELELVYVKKASIFLLDYVQDSYQDDEVKVSSQWHPQSSFTPSWKPVSMSENNRETDSFSMSGNPFMSVEPSKDSESSINVAELPKEDAAFVEPSEEIIPEHSPETNSSSVPEKPSIIEQPSEQQASKDSESPIEESMKDLTIVQPSRPIPEHNPQTASSAKPLIQGSSEEHSKHSTPASEKPSSKKKKKIPPNSFSLELKPVGLLTVAIRALEDDEFNEKGTAMIQVTPEDFTLTVRTGPGNNVVASLQMFPQAFIKYDFRKQLVRKMINLHEISKHLDSTHQTQTVIIYHVQGSDKLSFILPEGDPVLKFDVDLHQSDPEFEEFPNLRWFCGLSILNQDFWKVLNMLKENETKLVSYGTTNTQAFLAVGGRRFDQKSGEEGGKILGMDPGEEYHAKFKWPYWNTLQKAFYLTGEATFMLADEPKDCIVWRFLLKGRVDLKYVAKASRIIPKYDIAEGVLSEDRASTKWHPLSRFRPS